MIVALLLAGGAALLVLGAELLVRGAARIAAAAGISPLVIGLTVVAFGTSAPELAVSTGATLAGDAGIAMGNVVGSNIFNVLFILGISALIAPLTVQRQLVRIDLPVMLIAAFALFAVAADGTIGLSDGLAFCAATVGYTVLLIHLGRKEANPLTLADLPGVGPDDDTAASRERAASGAPARTGARLLLSAATALVGLVLLVIGSRAFVSGAVDLAETLGISSVVIGLTIIAAGTSLPEVATSILASIRGQRDIAIGNVVGSNIFNIFAILGICGVVDRGEFTVPASMLAFDIPVMIAVTVATFPIFFSGLRISRGEGVLFLAGYVAYTTYLILDVTGHDALHGFSRIMLLVVLPATAVALAIMLLQALRRS